MANRPDTGAREQLDERLRISRESLDKIGEGDWTPQDVAHELLVRAVNDSLLAALAAGVGVPPDAPWPIPRTPERADDPLRPIRYRILRDAQYEPSNPEARFLLERIRELELARDKALVGVGEARPAEPPTAEEALQASREAAKRMNESGKRVVEGVRDVAASLREGSGGAPAEEQPDARAKLRDVLVNALAGNPTDPDDAWAVVHQWDSLCELEREASGASAPLAALPKESVVAPETREETEA